MFVCKLLNIVLISTFLLFNTAFVLASPWQNSDVISGFFAKENLTGTFVVYDVTANQLIGYNYERAQERFIPASTFKISNSLIGLEVGAVKDVDEIFIYDGSPRMFEFWEKDMGLREAIAVSNVPIYQELARRITLEKMNESIQKLNYGNMDIGDKVDMFWLEGPLKISAIEQT